MGAVVAALTVAAPAYASAPVSGSGTGTLTSRSITSQRLADGNLIQTRELAGTVTGTLTGNSTETVAGVVHPTGLVTFHGVMSFTGTVQGCNSGKPGTVMIGLSGQGQTGAPATVSSIRIINQVDDTLGVTGVGTVTQTGLSLTYDVQYRC